MDVLKMTCIGIDPQKCHQNLVKQDNTIISILHLQNNHLVFASDDYDQYGHVKRSSFTKTVEDKLDNNIKSNVRKMLRI